MERLFVDTSAWYALVNRAAPEHRDVQRVIRQPAVRLVTSNFIFDETVTLALARLGHAAAVQIGSALRATDRLDYIRLTADDERAAWDLFGQRPDQTFSHTDCTSFVLMRRLKLRTAVALDDDFRAEGFALLP